MPAHSAAVDAELHVVGYFQSSDPGAIGAGKVWVDTTNTPHEIKIRAAGNASWTYLGYFTGPITSAGADNEVVVSGSVSASPVTVTATGTDTDIDISLVPKGAGGVQIGIGATPLALFKTVTLAVDPANQAAAGAFRTPLTFPGATFSANAMVVPFAPAALEANLAVGGFIVTGADAGDLCLTAIAAVNGISRTWTFLIIEP